MPVPKRNNVLDTAIGREDLNSGGLPSGAVNNSQNQPNLGIFGDLFKNISFLKTNNKSLKNSDTPTITSKEFDGSKDATSFTKSIDPSNLSGTIPFGLDIAQLVKKNSGEGKSPLSSDILQLLQQFVKSKSKDDEEKIKKKLEEEDNDRPE
jgi:hypothetical protein